MQITPTQRNLAAAALLALLAGLGVTSYLVTRDLGHIEGGWMTDAGGPLTECGFWTVRGPSQVWAQFGLELPDGGEGLAIAKICYATPDGGVDPGPQDLPSGIEWLDDYVRPYIQGEPVFEVWVAGHKDAPWRCSCKGSDGTKHKMPCGCWTAACGIPAACKLPPPPGVECGDDPWGGVYGTCKDGLECFGQHCVPPAGPDADVDAKVTASPAPLSEGADPAIDAKEVLP